MPPEVTAKTRQEHDYPSAVHRRSYARRTGAERGFATAKDPATNNISRGWCRLMGLTPAQVDAGERPGLTTEEKAEIKALKQEVAELRRANEILKAASAFFAAELGRPPRGS